MKISLKWLNDYIDVKDYFEKPAELGRILTEVGLELESLAEPGKALQNVVIGKILERGQHPNADRLTLCKVQIAENDVKQIVCGAKNHKAGDYVVVALPGAVLPGDFAIRRSKIRDVESDGMLCSEKELGLAEDSEGILILPQESPIGQSFASFWGLDDVILELKVTPNRADCLSHIGLARELSCLLNRPLKMPEAGFIEAKRSTKDLVKVELKDDEFCPRYAGRMMVGVKVGPSPQWLRKRLETIGMKSINNIVDVTNYIMMELGQPLHAFDMKNLKGSKVVIARSVKGERFQSLDGTDLELTGEELMIRDAERPVAMAGVVGGLNSGVTDSTTEIFIESAYFLSSAVRRTCRRFGFETDSAYRFSRGTDPDGVLTALKRACHLIQKVAGGEVLQDFYDVYPQPLPARLIAVSVKQVEERMGYPVLESEFKTWMTRLGCQIDSATKDGILKIRPPAYRWDLNLDVDLIEEFGRLNGYDKIPEKQPISEGNPLPQGQNYSLERKVAENLSRLGYHQCVNYGFTSEKWQKSLMGDTEKGRALGLPYPQEAIKILNPLTEELNVMRFSLMPCLLGNLRQNFHHGNLSGRLFEVGYGFQKSAQAGVEKNAYKQSLLMGLMAWGEPVDWTKSHTFKNVFLLKTSMENILGQLGTQAYRWQNLGDKTPEFLHPAQSAGLFFEGKMVGFVGTLHPALAEEWKIRADVAIAEFDVEKLYAGQPRKLKIKKISKLPQVERDLAFVLPTDLDVGEVMQEIRKQAGSLMQSLEVFDVFTGGNLAAGQRSVAFRLVYQDLENTLSENQIQDVQGRVIKGLNDKFGISVR